MKKIIVLMLGIMLFFTGCGKNTSQSKNNSDTLRVCLSEDAKNIDTAQINDDYSVNIINQVYDTLVELKPDGSLVNSLAEKIKNPDPQTFIITLKPGIKFSNGDDLTVEDVIFSLKRAASSDQFKTFYGKIDENSYEKIDDRTLKFTLKEIDATFLKALGHPAVSIVSKKFVENGGDLTKDCLGTGAYVLDEWVQNDHANFSYNKYYWGAEPKYKNIEMKVIPESSQRLIEVESGGMDLALKIDPNDIKSIEENEDLKLLKKMDNSVHFIGFNMAKKPFDNKIARQALVNAIDMESIFKTVYMNSGTLASSPVNPNFKYSLAGELKPYNKNIEKAKELFAKANIKDDSELTIYVSDNQTRVNVATRMQDQLKDFGINLKVVRLEWGAFMDALKNGDHNMFIMSWNPSIIDTHYELYQPFHSNNKGIGPNFTFYGNKDLDTLIDQGTQTFDDNKRKEIYEKAQRLIYEDMPWMYICYGETLMAASKDLPDFDMEAGYAQRFKNIR